MLVSGVGQMVWQVQLNCRIRSQTAELYVAIATLLGICCASARHADAKLMRKCRVRAGAHGGGVRDAHTERALPYALAAAQRRRAMGALVGTPPALSGGTLRSYASSRRMRCRTPARLMHGNPNEPESRAIDTCPATAVRMLAKKEYTSEPDASTRCAECD